MPWELFDDLEAGNRKTEVVTSANVRPTIREFTLNGFMRSTVLIHAIHVTNSARLTTNTITVKPVCCAIEKTLVVVSILLHVMRFPV
jgi:hypothetical protein